MVARRQRLEHRGGRRHARGEQRALRAVLELRDQLFGLIERRVVGARIAAAAAVLVVGVADEGGRRMDRRRDRLGDRVDPAERLRGQ